MRILYVSNPTMQSPYLSSHAANLAWLPGALRERGHDVTVRLSADPLGEASQARDESFDFIEVHDSGTTYHQKRAEDRRLLQTAYCRRVTPGSGEWIALSAMQAEPAERAPRAVIPPAIHADSCEYPKGHDESIAFAFDGHDIAALRAAISVSRNTERPLTVLISAATPVVPEALEEIERAARYVELARISRDAFPEALATSAAYLSFQRGAFDMAALTAMACGTAVLTLNGLPGAEIVVHGESGFVTESAEAAARAIERLDMLRPLRSRERARVVFDAGSAAARHEALWEALKSGANPRPMMRSLDLATAPAPSEPLATAV